MKQRTLLLAFLLSIVLLPAEAQEIQQTMPIFAPQLKATLTYPLAWGGSDAPRRFSKWKKNTRAKVFECMAPAPPMAESWDMEVVAEEQREGYKAQKILFNVNAWCRVPAYLLVPDGEGPWPAVLALHDHGAHFTIGKEKMVRPFGVTDEVMTDADNWSYDCYDGRYVGDYLAQHGFVVLAVDALLWGDRGRAEGPDYDAQQALNANLQQMGMSFGAFIAWDDLRSVSFLNSLPFVQKNHIATVGHSMGAHRAWMTAALTDEVNACVAVCWMNTTDSLMTLTNNQNKGGSAYSMIIPGLRNYLDYPDVASLACPKPMFFMNGRYDKLFPVQGVEDAYNKMQKVWHSRKADSNFRTEIVEGPHYYTRAMQDSTLAFLKNVNGNANGNETSYENENQYSLVVNPLLPTDFSDPDVIRVGDKYYMTCSEFHYMGMPVMESDNLVDWRVIAQVYDSIPLPGYGTMQRYAQGTWAPTIRYHDGKFWIFVCTPYDGLFMTTAEKPEGPWAPLHCVKKVEKWEDPCPFWDEDGNAYLGHSLHGAGPIIVHRMSPDGRELLDDGVTVYQGPVAEGTKFHQRDGWCWLSIPEGGVGTGWQMALRSRSIYGPYEGRRVLEQGSTSVNGPHQGALVDTPDGQWWFFHFQDTQPLGRIVHLQPVAWEKDSFPRIGNDYDGNGIGEPVKVIEGLKHHDRSQGGYIGDDVTAFDDLQWQWNHNPRIGFYLITPAQLSLHSLPARHVREALNQYTLKTYGNHSRVTVTLSYAAMQPGQRAGLESIGRTFRAIGVEMTEVNGKEVPQLYTEMGGEVTYHRRLPLTRTDADTVQLTLDIQSDVNRHRFWYSTDGINRRFVDDVFAQRGADWKGSRIGLFTYHRLDDDGEPVGWGGDAEFTHFCYEIDKKSNFFVQPVQ